MTSEEFNKIIEQTRRERAWSDRLIREELATEEHEPQHVTNDRYEDVFPV